MQVTFLLAFVLLLTVTATNAQTARCVAKVGTPDSTPQAFSVIVSSKAGETENVVVAWKPQSTRPAKQIAELQLLECGFKAWLHDQYVTLLKQQQTGKP